MEIQIQMPENLTNVRLPDFCNSAAARHFSFDDIISLYHGWQIFNGFINVSRGIMTLYHGWQIFCEIEGGGL